MTVEKIPAWPDPTSPEGKNFFANAKAILAAWEAKGASNPLAFAMLAQAEAESSFDPNAKGDHNPNGEPTAFGLHQWHHPRLTTISVRTGINIEADVLSGKGTVASQIDAAWWELSGLPWLGLKAIQAQITAYGAAMQACTLFERASAADAAQRRGAMAERWLAYSVKEGWAF